MFLFCSVSMEKVAVSKKVRFFFFPVARCSFFVFDRQTFPIGQSSNKCPIPLFVCLFLQFFFRSNIFHSFFFTTSAIMLLCWKEKYAAIWIQSLAAYIARYVLICLFSLLCFSDQIFFVQVPCCMETPHKFSSAAWTRLENFWPPNAVVLVAEIMWSGVFVRNGLLWNEDVYLLSEKKMGMRKLFLVLKKMVIMVKFGIEMSVEWDEKKFCLFFWLNIFRF